ncbi:unnamed protein product, partial [Mesorhabditis belari]|uniref:Uncharacterized protein n=1 Tax=Mesorhabditis belari TaxID=2138241 RepID=A0AAF3EED9_9BILA
MKDVEKGLLTNHGKSPRKEKSRLIPELQLNVTKFYEDEEQMKLMLCEESPALIGDGVDEEIGDEIEFYQHHNDDEIYEIVCFHRIWRCPKASLLAFTLLLALALGIVVLVIVMVCTFISLSQDKSESSREDVLGVISWLHYPVGDIPVRRLNHSLPLQHLNNFHY